jgi:mRNA interferase YafQ
MKYKLKLTSLFKKDVKRMKKRGRDMKKLDEVVTMLQSGTPLSWEFRDHALSGDYSGFRECHIQSDWLLVYYIDEEQIVLVCSRTGTHSDIF